MARWPGWRDRGRSTTTEDTREARAPEREIPALDAVVELPAGRYTLGEPGEERSVELDRVLIRRWPVVNAHLRGFAARTAKRDDPQLADHPATDVTLAEAEAFCAWASDRLGRRVRLPTGDEWEALTRGTDGRPWPWGHVFDEARCACAEGGWGWTAPVSAHPAGASPFGAEQLAGNVWEWVADRTPEGWGIVRGGSYLDTGWGLRASRVQPADPSRATATTGFRIAIDDGSDP
jgi:formylglycine-generating enzyme required for sulfatase activity